jgi:hypothetical protein
MISNDITVTMLRVARDRVWICFPEISLYVTLEEHKAVLHVAMAELDARIESQRAAVRKKVAAMQKEVAADAKREAVARDQLRHRLLLREAAHVLSGIVEDFMFGDGGLGCLVQPSLAKIAPERLSEQRKRRWVALQMMLAPVMSFSKFVEVDGYLRKLRFEDEYPGDVESITSKNLEPPQRWPVTLLHWCPFRSSSKCSMLFQQRTDH